MTMKKKVLTTLSVVLILAMAALGILAYLSDTDSDVNVMTLGNVSIDQHEYQRADGVNHNETADKGDLVEFDQYEIMMPAVPKSADAYTAEPTDLFYWGPYVTADRAGNGLWDDSNLANVRDKMIFVENTGESDAYYRTVIAFECPEGMAYSEGSDKEFMMNVNLNQRFAWEEVGYTNIDGTRYLLMEALYKEVLGPGEISRPSLLQVVMTHNATNEHMALLGDTYEILAFTQAVQAKGFADAETALDTAFYNVTVDKHPWVDVEDVFLPTADVDYLGKLSGFEYNKNLSPLQGPVSLDAAYTFTAKDTPEDASQSKYGDWICDYVIKSDRDIKADTAGLAGNYGPFGWIGFVAPETLPANEELHLLQYSGLDGQLTYENICDYVKEFTCGAFDINGQNKGTTLTVELRMFDPSDSSRNTYYTIGKYSHTF